MELNIRNQENKEFFDEKAEGYDEVHKPFMNTKNLLTENIDINPKRVIDLGAGTGLELIEFFNKFPNSRVTAIDLSEEMLKILKTRSFADKVDIICGDFFSIDFGQDIDVIMSTSALHHFLYAEKLKLYKKIYNSLRSGGIFINSDYTAKDEQEEKQCIYNYEHKVNRHNDTPLSLEHELEILKQIGFIDIEVKQPEKESYKLIKARK
jgi:tRNA (cmo5U34)-methyltransferase